jgi:hypothetical protein
LIKFFLIGLLLTTDAEGLSVVLSREAATTVPDQGPAKFLGFTATRAELKPAIMRIYGG